MADGTARWYVVHTYAGYENKVANDLMTTVENRNLQDMILEVKIPTETVVERKKVVKEGVKKKDIEDLGEEAYEYVDISREEKVFPSYVFVKMIYTDETWYIVRNIRGCTGFVGPSSKPVPHTEEEVYRLGVETKIVEINYQLNDTVRIIDGPLEDFIGIVDELDVDKNYVRVTISMFGRETPVELELNQVELVEE